MPSKLPMIGLRLPPELKAAAERAAAQDHRSLNNRILGILCRFPLDGSHIAIGITMPELPHVDAFCGNPDQGIVIARTINEELGLATNVRLASRSDMIYAKFPAIRVF